MIEFILIAVLSVGATFLIKPTLRRLTRYRLQASACEEEFFRAAGKLVEDDDTPEIVLDRIEIMAGAIRNSRVSHVFAYGLISGEIRSFDAQADKGRPSELGEAVNKMRPELQKLMVKVIVSFMIAVTYRSLLTGWFVRRTAFALFDTDRPPARQVGIYEKMRWFTSHAAGAHNGQIKGAA